MKQTLTTLTLATVAALTSVTVQAKDDKIPQGEMTLTVADFTKIENGSVADVEYTQGTLSVVKVTGRQDLLQSIGVSSAGGILTIAQAAKVKFGDDTELKVIVTAPMLASVSLTGSGDFEAKSDLNVSDLELSSKGSGDFEFENVHCGKLTIELKGTGDLEAKSFEASSLEASLKGAGDLELDKLVGNSLTLSSNGAGDTEVKSCQVGKSEWTISGSGDVGVGLEKAQKSTFTLKGSGDAELRLQECGEVSISSSGSGDVYLTGTAQKLNREMKGSGRFREGTKR